MERKINSSWMDYKPDRETHVCTTISGHTVLQLRFADRQTNRQADRETTSTCANVRQSFDQIFIQMGVYR